MNSKIKFCVFGILTIASAVVTALFSDNYYGVPFEYDYVCLIFTLIEFSCVSTACKISESCLFCNEHRAIRHKSRKSVIKFEIRKRIIYIIILSLLHSSVIAVIKKIGVKNFILITAFEFLAYLFLALVQFYLEVRFNSDTGYLAVTVGYIALVFIGIMLYDYCDSHSNMISSVFEIVNKFNIANYSSLARVSMMNCNIYLSMLLLALFDALTGAALFIGLKKTDIMDRS